MKDCDCQGIPGHTPWCRVGQHNEATKLRAENAKLREMNGAHAEGHMEALRMFDEMKADRDRLAAELAEVTRQRDEFAARLAGAEAANSADKDLAEHAELSGHIERVEECRDWIEHEHIMDGGDTSGRLRDFVESLGVVVHQLDVQRRSRNWYEAAYRAGKQKIVENRVAWMRPVYNAAVALRMVTKQAESAQTPAECNQKIIDNANAFRVLFDAVDAAQSTILRLAGEG